MGLVCQLQCPESKAKVPHRHFVFSIPKILRRYFLYDRSLLSELSRCAWEALRVFFREAVEWGWNQEAGDTMFHLVNAYTRAAQFEGLSAKASYRRQKVGGMILGMLIN
jgi:hypothetical protein